MPASKEALLDLKTQCELIDEDVMNVLFTLLKASTRSQAKEWLLTNAPQLATHHMEELVQFYAIPDRPILINKSKFYAVAWMLGASWGQLAQLFNVTRPTVASSARRYINQARREEVNGNKVSNLKQIISYEQLSAIHALFMELSQTNFELIYSAEPEVIADYIKRLLIERANELSEDSPNDPYGDAPARSMPKPSTNPDDEMGFEDVM